MRNSGKLNNLSKVMVYKTGKIGFQSLHQYYPVILHTYVQSAFDPSVSTYTSKSTMTGVPRSLQGTELAAQGGQAK